MDNKKKCKHCGSEMDLNAKICPTCRKRQSLAWWQVVLIVLGVIILIGVLFGGDSEKNSNSENNKSDALSGNTKNQTIEYTPVDIDVLEDALDNNAAAAKETYNGKYFEITGRLGNIDSDLKYISILSTTDSWDIIGVHCTIKNDETREKVKTLSKDQTIIVKGKITNVGEVMGYYLDVDEIIIP